MNVVTASSPPHPMGLRGEENGDFTSDQAVIGLRTQPVYSNALTPELERKKEIDNIRGEEERDK
jgi:hypothetical protein